MAKQSPHLLENTTPFLRGIAQIMLQNSPWTGLFFLVGICLGSLTMGLAAIVAVTTGTVTAMLLNYNENEINSGLYGFSATLVGVALICFFQPTIIIWITIIVGSVFATVIQHLFIIKKIPAFTFPFILITWLYLFIFNYFPNLASPQPTSNITYSNDYITLFSHSFGQVIFQSNIWSGMLFAIGIVTGRSISAIYATAGIILSSIIAYQLKGSVNDIYLGLLSYNAVLCAITFAGNKAEDLLMALISVIFSVLIMIQMQRMNLPALTFPFVLATWLVLGLKNLRAIYKQNI